jgi:hypothetical protein
MSTPSSNHYHTHERVMRYLVSIIGLGIHYSGHPAMLDRYSDSNWIFDVDDLHCTSGYVFTHGWCNIM